MKVYQPAPHAKLDLLIIDIDDAFIYHRTIANLNSVFLTLFLGLFQETLDPKMFCTTGRTIRKTLRTAYKVHRFRWDSERVKKILFLSYQAALLHSCNLIRKLANTFHAGLSSERLIRRWADTIVRLGIHEAAYRLEEDTVEKNIHPNLFGLYSSLKRINPDIRVLALSEHFSVGKDSIHKALGADDIVTNRFKANRKGIISGHDIVIASPEDKLKVAEGFAKSCGAKEIGLIIEDWDDRLLLDLPGVKYVLYRPRLKRFIPEGVEAIPF